MHLLLAWDRAEMMPSDMIIIRNYMSLCHEHGSLSSLNSLNSTESLRI